MKMIKWRKKTFLKEKHVDSFACADANGRSLYCQTDGDVSGDDRCQCSPLQNVNYYKQKTFTFISHRD